MRSFITFIFIVSLFGACTSDSDPETNFLPIPLNLSFEVLHANGSSPVNNEMEISRNLILENGELVVPNNNELTWEPMGRITSQSIESGSILFGPSCFGNCEEEYRSYYIGTSNNNEDGSNETINETVYNFIRYSNGSNDTLRVNIIRTFEPNTQEINVSINGEEKTLYDPNGGFDNLFDTFSYIVIQK
ncbi:MAG: hypothetical protein ACI849_001304 [Patiriisocius sp.]|jgi:hypothetical protein